MVGSVHSGRRRMGLVGLVAMQKKVCAGQCKNGLEKVECRGELKMVACRRFLSEQGWRRAWLFRAEACRDLVVLLWRGSGAGVEISAPVEASAEKGELLCSYRVDASS